MWSTINGLFNYSFDDVRVRKKFALVVFAQCIRAIPTTKTDRLSDTLNNAHLRF